MSAIYSSYGIKLPFGWWRFTTTIEKGTKLLPVADDCEQNELTVFMDDFYDWAAKLKDYRKKNHITQQELAEYMGVKHFTLRSWEQQKAKPPYHMWVTYKSLLDDSVGFS